MDEVQCQGCGAVVNEILAVHHYAIEQDSETGQWTKTIGEVDYWCSNCQEEFSCGEIDDVLRQVDEL